MSIYRYTLIGGAYFYLIFALSKVKFIFTIAILYIAIFSRECSADGVCPGRIKPPGPPLQGHNGPQEPTPSIPPRSSVNSLFHEIRSE